MDEEDFEEKDLEEEDLEEEDLGDAPVERLETFSLKLSMEDEDMIEDELVASVEAMAS